MPGSISSTPESPDIMRFVVSVGCLVFSLMLTSFGIVNNAWIVLDRPNENDEFQRGIRGHDCYRNNAPGNENIFCLPWDFEDKAEKFPDPFTKVLAASTVVRVTFHIALVILAFQIFYLAYTIGHCCSQSFTELTKKRKLAFFHAMLVPVGLWIILLLLVLYETYTDNLLPLSLRKEDYKYKIGSGFWFFFLGGLLPFIGALYFLFREQMDASKTRLRGLINRHQPIPSNVNESDRDGVELVRTNHGGRV
ncbi:uncharacterized protein CELE_T22E5.6 [Caenorhabditis elegans]|uniref:Transmembrane protein n=1 Tax=Caenorhabditis elegans TaxID=6239 RepID=Q22684_CAEEL|nr:Transmembrane protein [Caenorhabditis elegans]CCD72847.1 Transmembrane protein [Caenorhabditis elegans]|eukprot:NP_509078.1 Uncharacterized protein CELE_T22E5.6 [Caenorhabditis elegans]